MDLSKIPNQRKLQICKFYQKVGWLCLPFIWAVNFIWFFKDAFIKPSFREQRELRSYVIVSGVGASIWIIGLTTWIYMYQTHRLEWGDWGEAITFLMPTGSL